MFQSMPNDSAVREIRRACEEVFSGATSDRARWESETRRSNLLITSASVLLGVGVAFALEGVRRRPEGGTVGAAQRRRAAWPGSPSRRSGGIAGMKEADSRIAGHDYEQRIGQLQGSNADGRVHRASRSRGDASGAQSRMRWASTTPPNPDRELQTLNWVVLKTPTQPIGVSSMPWITIIFWKAGSSTSAATPSSK